MNPAPGWILTSPSWAMSRRPCALRASRFRLNCSISRLRHPRLRMRAETMTGTLKMHLTHPIRSWSYTMRNRSIGLQSALAALAVVFCSCAMAQEQPQSLEEVVRAMQQERQAVAEAEAEASRLEGLRNRLDRELAELRDQLAERQGEFGELFGVARAAAADLDEQLSDSLISVQFPNRGDELSEMAQSDSLPTIDQLEGLWFTFLQEMTEQGNVARFNANVVRNDNSSTAETVVRIGPFTAFGDQGYLVLNDNTLRYLARQPGGGAVAAARRVMDHTGPGVVRGMIDPSLGSLLGLVTQTPTLRERIDQGGAIGYAIIVVAALGILLAVYRWLILSLTSMKVRRQMGKHEPNDSNPLGRIQAAYEEHKSEGLETLQLHLDDAVLKELPPLERGLNLVKVLAAVAPLMGLLGTVI